jgi:hypothetical protein
MFGRGTESLKRKSAIKFVSNTTELRGAIGFVVFRVIFVDVLCSGRDPIHEITRNHTKEVSESHLRDTCPSKPRFYFLSRWIRLNNLIELISDS